MSLLVFPILIPLLAAVCAFFCGRRRLWQAYVSVGASVLQLGACGMLFSTVRQGGIQAEQMGGWPAPFGITLAADHLSAVMLVITAIIGLAANIYALADIDKRYQALGFHTLYQILIAAISGAFLTGDLFNLYVWFEVMLMASFGLLVMGGEPHQLDGGVKYVTLNLIATLMFITGLGLLYALTGTLNMAHLYVKVQAVDNPALMTTVAMLFIMAFGLKAGAFPLFFWLPASYHTPPPAIAAVFSGLLTKVGVYALIRAFTLIFIQDVAATHGLILIMACFTMVVGVLGAAVQNAFRRILAFHIISQVGYMILGLGLYTRLALAGAVFYLIHHIIVKANLFLISGLVSKIYGHDDLKHLGDLYQRSGLMAVLFIIPAFSLAGFPPLSGFWAKFVLIQASLEKGAYLPAALALVVGLLTVYSMTKIWIAVFWEPPPEVEKPTPPGKEVGIGLPLLVPVMILAAMTVVIGLGAQPLMEVALAAADELLAPQQYVQAVLVGEGS
ncbi:MAG: Na+/H+ antiporter subunit D [Desulfobacterales bacterium]|nr:Na+/H+ antiporter subunit D [Desulfobacterales bacterium]